MFKERKKTGIIGISFVQIFILVCATFAFSFMLSQVSLVSAQELTPEDADLASQLEADAYRNTLANTPPTNLLELTPEEADLLSSQAAATKYTSFAGTPNPASAGKTASFWARLTGGTASGTDPFATKSYEAFGKLDTGLTGVPAHIAQGLVWATVAYFGAKQLGSMLGLSKNNQDALSYAALGAVGAFKLIQIAQFKDLGWATNVLGKGSVFGGAPLITAIGVGALIFILMYGDEKQKTVTFTCQPWEPPLGGAKCDECNKDKFRQCSEYRCKSLGQACELVNVGSANEQCIWKSRGDVNSPTITPNASSLDTGLTFKPLLGRPIERGTRIEDSRDAKGCLKAFTQLKFGLDTNEPAQCKLDYIEKNISEMQFYLAGSTYYQKNHLQIMSLPSPVADRTTAPLFKNDGTMDLYVRCQDANGNVNDDVYVVEFCVNKGPDTTPPVIEQTSITSGSPVRYQVDSVPLKVYTNEPAQCKWSTGDKIYDNLENSFACSGQFENINANQLYPCTGNLTGVKDKADNQYYFRCRDGAGNLNAESYKFNLKGSQPLNIKSVGPNATISGSTNAVEVKLTVETEDGSDEGKATCYYNSTLTSGFVVMFKTNAFQHEQIQSLGNGEYAYNFKCVDAGGNTAEISNSFTVKVDKEAPRVTRTYHDTNLKIVTDEPAICTYSIQNCNFNIDEGLQMEYANTAVKNVLAVAWDPKIKYYIKCTDAFGNEPLPNDCSVIVSPRQF